MNQQIEEFLNKYKNRKELTITLSVFDNEYYFIIFDKYLNKFNTQYTFENNGMFYIFPLHKDYLIIQKEDFIYYANFYDIYVSISKIYNLTEMHEIIKNV